MALRLRRGTNADRLTVTPAEGELLYTTDSKKIYAGDGSTVGGNIVSGINNLLEDLTPQLGGDLDLNSKNIVGNGNVNILGTINATGILADVYGSVFGTDSQLLVDVINSKVILANNSINELIDVNSGGATPGQVLKWSGTNWTPQDDSILNLSGVSINALQDVDTTGVTLGQVLKWSGTAWTPQDADSIPDLSGVSINALQDVTTGSAGIYDVLQYNGNTWTSQTIDLTTISINALKDVNSSGATPGQILVWNGLNWEPKDEKLSSGIFYGDVKGSVFGFDSSVLVDATENRLILDNNFLTDLNDVNMVTSPSSGYFLLHNGFYWDSTPHTIESLNNVFFASPPENGDILKFNGANWIAVPDSIPDLSGVSINALQDVDTTGVTTGQVLKWSGTAWTPQDDNIVNLSSTSIDALQDVTTSSAGIYDVLQYNGNTWTSQTIDLTTISINALKDVNTTGATPGQILVWNGLNWTPKDEKLSSGIFYGDVKGSVFGFDSSVLVDATENRLILDNNFLTDLNDVNMVTSPSSGYFLLHNGFYWDSTPHTIESLNNVFFASPPVKGDILKFNGANWIAEPLFDLNIEGVIEADVQGSLYGVDSTILYDAVNQQLYLPTELVTGNAGTRIFRETTGNNTIQIEGNDDRGVLSILQTSNNDLSGYTNIFGGVYFGRQDPINNQVITNLVLGSNNKLIFAVNNTGDFNGAERYVTLEQFSGSSVGLGIGTLDPTVELDVQGNASVTGYLQVGSDTDPASNITGAIGMIIYNSTTNKFQGYTNTGWVDLH